MTRIAMLKYLRPKRAIDRVFSLCSDGSFLIMDLATFASVPTFGEADCVSL